MTTLLGVHAWCLRFRKTREIKKDSKTGAVPVKADLNILYTGSQDEYWLNLSEDRKFKQEKMDSHGMVISGISYFDFKEKLEFSVANGMPPSIELEKMVTKSSFKGLSSPILRQNAELRDGILSVIDLYGST